MKKYLFLLSCLLLLSGELFAQDSKPEGYTDSDGASLNAQKPTVEKIVGSSVDYYTGTANIGVSLHTISSYGFKIPVALQYTASGVKYETYANGIGDNWKLAGAGRITRTVKGQPDEAGWIAGHGTIALGDLANEWNREAIEQKISNGFDSEPDFYQFELPTGQYGSFVMNSDRSIILFPYQDIKIEWKIVDINGHLVDSSYEMNSSIYEKSCFVITDANGIKYYFGISEDCKELSTYYLDNNGKKRTYTTGWMLEYIEDGGKEIARYSYNTISERFNGLKNFYWRFEYNQATNSVTRISEFDPTFPIYVTPRVLASITWELGKLEFTTSQSTLDAIKVIGYQNELLKTIHLKRTDGPRDIIGIYETSSGRQRDICSFEYYNDPSNVGTRTDRWGYPNGEDAPFYSYPKHTFKNVSVAGLSREPNLSTTRKRSLRKIIYPTGGWTEFEYELHQGRYPMNGPDGMYMIGGFWGGDLYTVGGLRIKSITQYESIGAAGSKTQYIYQHPSDATKGGQIFSGFLDTRERKETGISPKKVTTYGISLKPDFQMLDYTGSPVLYNYVREILPNGSYNEYEFAGLSDYMDIKGQAARSTPSGLNIYENDSHHMVPFSSRYFGRGLLKQKKQYDNSGQAIHTESYTYNIGPEKAGVYSYTLFAINPESDEPEYYKGRYRWSSQPVVLSSKTTSGLYETPVTTTYSYLSDYNDLLPRTIVETSGESSIKTTLKYPQDYYAKGAEPHPDTLAVGPEAEAHGIAWLIDKGVISVPIETIHYRKAAGTSDYNVIGGTVNLYVWSSPAKRWLPGISEPLIVNTLGTALTGSYINTDAGTAKKTLVRDSRYDRYAPKILSFNQKGNPTSISNAGNSRGTYSGPLTIIYGYGGHIPTAYVKNAVPGSASCFYSSFEEESSNITLFLGSKAKSGNYVLNKNTAYTVPSTGAVISYWRWDGNANTKWEEVRITPATNSYVIREPNHYVDEVRVMPPGASMTTQIEKPGGGIISKVDEKGASTRYNYNTFGMLESVVRHDGQILEKYAYSYNEASELWDLSARVDAGSLGRGQVSVNPVQVSTGGSATFSTSSLPGYLFSQWQFSDGTTSADSVTVKSNIRADLSGVASFRAAYTMSTRILNGKGTASVNPGKVIPGGAVTFSAMPKAGYQFSKWQFSDGTTSTDSVTVKNNIRADLTGTATFDRAYYLSVAVSPALSGRVSVSPAKVFPRDSATFTATPLAGYKFSKWEFIANGTVISTSTDSVTVKSNIQTDLIGRAYFIMAHNMSAVVAGGSVGRGQASVTPSLVAHDGSATFTATPNAGYQFSKWQFSDGTTSTTAVTVKNNVKTDLTGTVSFTASNYTMSAVVAGGSVGHGQASVTPVQVGHGGQATWWATPSSGYAFDHWAFSDGTTVYTSSVTKTGITQNITGTAYFKEVVQQTVNFRGTIMPRNGYWAINISGTPDIISDGSGRVSATGYFFINPDSPDRRDAQFDGVVDEYGYILSNAAFNEEDTTGELSGQIHISDSNYKVGTVSWR